MEEKTLATRTIYDGRILRLDVVDVEIESGVRSTREIIRHPGAVVVIGELPDGRFVMVRQYRKPVEKEIIEAVAGVLEKGESPSVCAAREVEEETGYHVDELNELGQVFTSPGFTDETLFLFHARLSSEKREVQLDDDERVEVIYFTKSEIEELMVSGEIADAKTLAAWWLYTKKIDVTG